MADLSCRFGRSERASGKAVGRGFLFLAIGMLLASVGMFRYRRWGWWLALRMFAANGLADIAQVFMGRVLEGAIGVTVAGAIITI